MKIAVKTLQQKIFYVEAEPAETVLDLKAKIESEEGHTVTTQQIIYSGNVLSDDKTIESCQIKENDPLLLVVSKPKPTSAAWTGAGAASPVIASPLPAALSTGLHLAHQQEQHPPPAPPSVAVADDPTSVDLHRIREVLTQNPALLQPMIQQLAQHNPHLAQVLAQNPEALLDLLEGGDEGDGQPPPPGDQVVKVTPEEHAAIEKLEPLGFTLEASVEAYFACDKNEELAANYLFECGFD